MTLSRRPASREELAALGSLLGAKPRVLAWASGPATLVAGLVDALAVCHGDSWIRVGYHEIVRGGWRTQDRTLWWIDADDVRHEFSITDPGRFAELFVERVRASIVIDRVVGEAGMQVRLVARRDLSDADAPFTWSATPVGTTKAEDPAFEQMVTAGIARLQRDYGIG